MFKQYTTSHETEAGTMQIERTYKQDASGGYAIDSILVTVKGQVKELPKSMFQTDSTIVRKVCAMLRGV